MNFSLFKSRAKNHLLSGLAIFILSVYLLSLYLSADLKSRYQKEESVIIYDRNGEIIKIIPNERGYYARYTKYIPKRFAALLIAKEDQWFWYHLGVNPIRIISDFYNFISKQKLLGSSTITQQLAKMLLQNESRRNLKNKLIELVYAISLELNFSKREILLMYINTAYFGKLSQGILEASWYYFNKPPETLTDVEILCTI